MKIPISRFNASNVSETRSISSVFPTFEASSGKRGPGKHELCSDQPPNYLPTRLSRRTPHLVGFSRSDRTFSPGSHW